MKLGIKIAPGSAWKPNILATHPSMVEIWYNTSKPADYDEMFAFLSTQHIDVGLHFWGVSDGLLADSSSPLITKTINVAAQNHCVYVNIHPDLCSALAVDFDTMNIHIAGPIQNPQLVQQKFIDNAIRLNTYAKTRGVILTVETVPLRDTPSWKPDRDRTQVIDIYQMPIDVFTDLAKHGIVIANDFGHTACNLITDNRTYIWQFLKTTTQTLAPATRLIHLGFIVPPYNGVDFHDSLDNPVFETNNAVPNKKELIELLKLFRNRDDVWMLVEPSRDHIKNYVLAKGILAQI